MLLARALSPDVGVGKRALPLVLVTPELPFPFWSTCEREVCFNIRRLAVDQVGPTAPTAYPTDRITPMG